MYHSKYRKWASQRKLNDCKYHVQERKYVSHTTMKISYATTQFTEFLFCGINAKPHGVRGLRKHYHIRLDPKFDFGE